MYAIVWYRPDPDLLDPRAGDFYARYVCLGLPLIVLSFSIGGTLYVGFVSRLRSTYDDDREWWARAGAWLLMALVGWLLVAGVVLYAPGLILYGGHKLGVAIASAGGITGLITLWVGRSATTPATRTPRADKSWTQIAMGVVTALAAPVAITVLITALSLGTGILLFMTWKSIAGTGMLDALFPVLPGAAQPVLDHRPSSAIVFPHALRPGPGVRPRLDGCPRPLRPAHVPPDRPEQVLDARHVPRPHRPRLPG